MIPKPEKPKAGDYWEFQLPGKPKRTKEVGSICYKDFLVERGTYPEWKDKTQRLLYVRWARLNKGRYSGITVRMLMKFGRRISTKAEREAHFQTILANARNRRAAAKKAGASP
jgi:uncharacterized protein YecE (DUF72 family)